MSELQPVVETVTERGLEVYVAAVPGRDGFDKLSKFVEQQYGASVLTSADGPDARVRTFLVGSSKLTLDYEDPFGNTFVSPDPSSETLKRISEDLRTATIPSVRVEAMKFGLFTAIADSRAVLQPRPTEAQISRDKVRRRAAVIQSEPPHAANVAVNVSPPSMK